MPQFRGEKNMKSLRVLLLICALPASAEIRVIDQLDFQPQERSQWCWAAVSAIAISGFPEAGGFRHLSQLEVVTRRRASALNRTQAKTPAKKHLIEQWTLICADPLNCDSPKEPLLFDLEADKPPRGSALSMSAFVDDISKNKKPVVIRWGFANSDATHALLVTGYNTDVNKLRIYDPLPLGSDPNGHESWISYEQYLNPSKFKGKSIVPKHEDDQYRMRLTGNPRPDGVYKLIPARVTTGPALPPGGIEPPEKLRGPIEGYIKQEAARGAFLKSNGEPRKGNFTAGTPIPVLTVDLGQLNAPPESLLVRHAHAYVVPVWQGTTFVDSFQLLPIHGGWRQGGYSSPKIASMLASLSEDPKNKQALRPGEVFYLVSIPEVAAFFLGHGFGNDAKLKSLDYGAKGDFVPASRAFAKLNEGIRRIEADRDVKPSTTTTH
jgi:hypothetical protein